MSSCVTPLPSPVNGSVTTPSNIRLPDRHNFKGASRRITQLVVLSIVLAFFAFSGLPARGAALQSGNAIPNSRESGIDPLTQYSFGGTGFDSTLGFLQKAEEERKRCELQERQRRRMENIITNVPERLLNAYFSRRWSIKTKKGHVVRTWPDKAVAATETTKRLFRY